MRKRNLKFRNPYLLFLPFLIYYLFFVLRHHNDAMIGDEGRYYMYAQNLLRGFYSPPPPEIYLWNGPGYPIFLMPFVFFKLPLIVITLANALLQYFSIIFLFKSLLKITNFKKAVLFSLFWGFSFGAYHFMPSILTESLTYFLISIFIYSLLQAFQIKNKAYIYLAGVVLGFIALTKIMFGYVLLFLFAGNIILWFFNKKKESHKISLKIFIIAFITVTPYLIYTYHLTGKFFYWGNSGGMSLYWMSTPYQNEYGDWNSESFGGNDPNIGIPNRKKFLAENHQKDLQEILKYKGVERDEVYKKLAIRNIKKNPKKYLKNIFSNMNRMFFGFPNSYSYQYPSRFVWYSGILFTLLLFSLILTLINWKSIDYPIKVLIMLTAIYLGGSLLVSADFRQFSVAIPLLLIWIAYILDRSLTIKYKF